MPKALLLNDTSAWYHWGCTGTSHAIKRQLDVKGYELVSFPVNYKGIDSLQPRTNVDYEDAGFFRRAIADNPELFEALSQADVIVVNGEGTLHHNNPVVNRLFYICYTAKRRLNKTVQIINHSAYPEVVREPRHSPYFMLYKIIYSGVDFVAIREHISHHLMSQIGIPCTLSFDCLPLTIKALKSKLAAQPGKKVVIAGSVALTSAGVDAVARYIRELNARGIEVQVLSGAAAHPAEDDLAFVQALKKRACEWQHVDATSLEQWLQVIASASLLVSGRFHHSIAAAFLGTPFIVMASNTLKNRALTEAFQLDDPLDFSHPNLHRLLLEKTERYGDVPLVSEEILGLLEERALRNFDAL